MSDKTKDVLGILFEGAAQAGGLDLAPSESWSPKDGRHDPAILATFHAARVIPVGDGDSWRAGLLVELVTHRGERLGWWPPTGTAAQLLRAIGAGSKADRLAEAKGAEIDELARDLGPTLDRLGQLGVFHAIAYSGTKATRRGRDADVYTVQATGLTPDDPRATPEILEAAVGELVERARQRLGAAPAGRGDL